MKQTTKRVLSTVLSVLMLLSSMSVAVFAENNYTPDEEYYSRLISDAVIVGANWSTLSEGDTVTYTYRGKNYTEEYDSDIHFSSVAEAYQHCIDANVKSPVIVLAAGAYMTELVIKSSVTILGANAGVNPSVIPEDKTQQWDVNPDRASESVLKGVITVNKYFTGDTEVVLDGVSLGKNFAFVDMGSKKARSSVVLRNSIVDGAGGRSYNNTAITNAISFSGASGGAITSAKIQNVRCRNMKSTSLVGSGLTNLEISGLYYYNSTSPAIMYGDAPASQNSSYVVTDSMFYNVHSPMGAVNVDPSVNENSSRTDTYFELSNCSFVEPDDYEPDSSTEGVSPVTFTCLGAKNRLNVHDTLFKCSYNSAAPAVGITFGNAAFSGKFFNTIKFNSNKLYGYVNLPDTSGLASATELEYSDNYFADFTEAQANPVFPSSASKNNVKVKSYWVDEAMTVPSSMFHITSVGIPATISNTENTITATVRYGQRIVFDIKASDPTVSYKIYDSEMENVVTEINSIDLINGIGKNVYYAVGSSSVTDFKFVYKLIFSSFNPEYTAEFDLTDTYMLTEEVEGMSTGEDFYSMWDGMTYRFTVGVNVFSNAKDIFGVCKGTPTIIIPAGTYGKEIHLLGSAVVLGAKHGINPNIPQYENPDVEWRINPERANADEESILRAVIGVEEGVVDTTVLVDGFTFGPGSAYYDVGESKSGYNTDILKNIIVDGATTANFTIEDRMIGVSSVVSVGGGQANVFGNLHKDTRLINWRMAKQADTKLIDSYYETLIMDGLYVAQNTTTLHRNEWSHTGNQNLYCEIRNCNFFKNTVSTYYILFDLTGNDDSKTNPRYNTIIFRHNNFYETTGSPYGLFGVRFNSHRDSLRVLNNTMIALGSKTITIIPGSSNWWKGSFIRYEWSNKDKYNLDDVKIIKDVEFKMNRFIGTSTQAVDMTAAHPDTVWDYSFNYFATSFSKSGAGKAISSNGTGQENNYTCAPYFTDWDLTTLSTVPESDKAAEARIKAFNDEFRYEIEGPGIVDAAAKTYTDTVSIDTKTYDFGVNLITPQAKCEIFTDSEMTEKVASPVAVAGGTNTYYIKISNFDGSKSDVYTATLTKPLGSEAKLLGFGNWRVSSENVFAAVPVGSSEFTIPEIVVSSGASYALYNDAACTDPLTDSFITVSGITPSYKYIKVDSEDGSASKVYKISVIAAESDQTEVTFIENATKVSETAFEAVIPSGSSSFNLVATVSENAVAYVYDNGQQIKLGSEAYVIDSIIESKTVDIAVKNEAGREKTFTLTISKEGSSCAVAYIQGMANSEKGEYHFQARTNGTTYKVVPTFVDRNATFELYNDKACTDKIFGTTVILKKADTDVYMLVTSADGKKTRVYTIEIHSSASNFNSNTVKITDVYEIQDATLTGADTYTIDLPEGQTSYKLTFKMTTNDYPNSQFTVYSDEKMSKMVGGWLKVADNNLSTEVPLFTKTTTLYCRAYIAKEVSPYLQTDAFKVIINSKRPVAKYTDESDIAAWASEQVKYLNENGFGYFSGDNGKFKPRANMTRFEVAVVAARVLGLNVQDYSNLILPFVDNIPNWAKPYVNAVYSCNIMGGSTNSAGKLEFRGKDPTTREQFAKIIVNVVAIAKGDLPANATDAADIYTTVKEDLDAEYAKIGFVDEDSIANWAKPYAKLAVSYYNLINGSKDGDKLKFNPKNKITRQEVAVIVANYSGYSAQ